MKDMDFSLEGDQEDLEMATDMVLDMALDMDMDMVTEMVLAQTSLPIHSTQPSGLRQERFLTNLPRFHQHLFI